jgi:hypothetical protein
MERFEDVQSLETEALRRLLDTGSTNERIWAAWTLGLRMGTSARPELLQASRREPDPGARRHLLVTLAGFKEIDALAAFARHDPDGFVRAAACHFLAAVSPPGDPAVHQLLMERLGQDPFAEVRLTIIRALKPSRDDDAGLLERLLEDPEPEIRAAAVEAFSGEGWYFTELLRMRVLVEQDPELRRRWLQRWQELEGYGALLAFAAAQPVPLALEIFALRGGREGQLDWETLAPLTAREEGDFEAYVLEWLKVRGAPAAAREWLLSLAQRDTRSREPSEHGTFKAWQAAWTARRLLLEALEGLHGEDLGEWEWQLLSGLQEMLEATPSLDDEDSQEEYFDEEEDAWVYGPSAEARLLERLQTLRRERGA